MATDVENNTARALDLLSPTQIMALCLGSMGLGENLRSHSHPRKTNALGRGNIADTYQMMLHHELMYGLAKRNPEKTRLVIREMAVSQIPELEQTARQLEDQLNNSQAA